MNFMKKMVNLILKTKLTKFIIKALLYVIGGIVLIIVLSLALLLGLFDRIQNLVQKLKIKL